MKRHASILLVVLALVALDKLQAQTLDVEQPLFTVTNDFNSADISGQTFTPTVTGKLYGIRL